MDGFGLIPTLGAHLLIIYLLSSKLDLAWRADRHNNNERKLRRPSCCLRRKPLLCLSFSFKKLNNWRLWVLVARQVNCPAGPSIRARAQALARLHSLKDKYKCNSKVASTRPFAGATTLRGRGLGATSLIWLLELESRDLNRRVSSVAVASLSTSHLDTHFTFGAPIALVFGGRANQAMAGTQGGLLKPPSAQKRVRAHPQRADSWITNIDAPVASTQRNASELFRSRPLQLDRPTNQFVVVVSYQI